MSALDPRGVTSIGLDSCLGVGPEADRCCSVLVAIAAAGFFAPSQWDLSSRTRNLPAAPQMFRTLFFNSSFHVERQPPIACTAKQPPSLVPPRSWKGQAVHLFRRLKRGRKLCRGKISSGTISWAAVLAPCDMMMPFLRRDTRDHVVRFTSRCYVTDYVTVKGSRSRCLCKEEICLLLQGPPERVLPTVQLKQKSFTGKIR